MRPYARLSPLPLAALRLYPLMARSGVPPDCYTLPILFKALSSHDHHLFPPAHRSSLGRQFHCVAIRHGLASHEFSETGLISVYAKSGCLDQALQVFDQNPHRKLGSWNALIAGYAQAGHSQEAIALFVTLLQQQQHATTSSSSSRRPDDVTMVSVASATGSLGDLMLAQQVHKCAVQAKPRRPTRSDDVLLWNSVIDMYAKCGRMDLAHKVFQEVEQQRRDVSTWTAMIMGYATHGRAGEALGCYRGMRESGVVPNQVTFVGVLTACVHGGLVEEGRRHWGSMVADYGIAPGLAHYGCMVDLLARAGRLEEARGVVEGMPVRPNAVIWGTLLGACEKHGNVEVGAWAAQNLAVLEPCNDGVYVVLSNIYATANMWDHVSQLRRLMKDKLVAKTPGCSSASTTLA